MRSLLFCLVVLISKLLVVSSGANADYEIPCVDNGLCINCGKYEMVQQAVTVLSVPMHVDLPI